LESCLYTPRPTRLEETGVIRRESVRPRALRPPGFDEQYDSTTLFYDAFWAGAEDRIWLIGPPLHNLRTAIDRMTVHAQPTGTRCRFALMELDRTMRVSVKAPAQTTALVLETAIGRFEVPVGPGRQAFFAGRRVIFTKSRNTPLVWIQDWARFNRDVQGADAILLYDNGSTTYEPAELVEALRGLAGFQRICVVSWPFKFGPLSIGDRLHWDSDYTQYGILDHGRWLFLDQARSVLSTDIDELVLAGDHHGVFEKTEQSSSGYLTFSGLWMPGLADLTRVPTDEQPIRHQDFTYHLCPKQGANTPPFAWMRRDNRCLPKWCVVPRRCPTRAQWLTHGVSSILPPFQVPKQYPPWFVATLTAMRRAVARLNRTPRQSGPGFELRHFLEITTGWKFSRSQRVPFDPGRHARDVRVAAHFARVRWES
jgi:hypothetical protein